MRKRREAEECEEVPEEEVEESDYDPPKSSTRSKSQKGGQTGRTEEREERGRHERKSMLASESQDIQRETVRMREEEEGLNDEYDENQVLMRNSEGPSNFPTIREGAPIMLLDFDTRGKCTLNPEAIKVIQEIRSDVDSFRGTKLKTKNSRLGYFKSGCGIVHRWSLQIRQVLFAQPICQQTKRIRNWSHDKSMHTRNLALDKANETPIRAHSAPFGL